LKLLATTCLQAAALKGVIFSAEGHMLAIEGAATAAREILDFLNPS
jgi:hypothetical protein